MRKLNIVVDRTSEAGIQESFIRCLTISFLAVVVATSVSAQQQANPSRGNTGSTYLGETSNLPVEKIGRDDLVGITVYDSPELTRTVRVGSDGDLRLPMLKQRIHAAGLYPVELEAAITTALIDENVLVEPIVTVSVVEYRSRPISVVGAVKNPITFQATGKVTLLDAISQAQGLTENAGSEILVSRQPSEGDDKSVTLIQRISVHGLLAGEDPTLNLRLEGGEEIRVPEAGRVFVVGNVKKPGAFYITDGSESSVMKALALSEGLDTFSGNKAYIYRLEAGSGGRNEVPVELRKIMARKSPDVPLLASDILYVPSATGLKASMKVLEASIGVGTGLASALLIYGR
jgi:polysaccharide export outer membrane protein